MNLKDFRQERQLTQAEMAKILQLNQPAYHRLENSKSILSIKNALKLSEHFEISLDEIYGITKKENKSMNINLETIRKENNLTQIEFCKILGIAQGNYTRLINDLENGKILNISIGIKLAEYLKIDLNEIYGITKEELKQGFTATIKADITPLEEDLLTVFREIGEYLGEPAQRAYLQIGKSITKNSQ